MTTATRPTFWAHQTASDEQIQAWVEQFHRDGYLFLKSVLTPEMCAEMRADLDRALAADPPRPNPSGIELNHRMFEVSRANLHLFELEPIVSFAEALIDGPCHVIHNNSFRTLPGGGITGWHQDDAPHIKLLSGEPPTNIRLSVTHFTANYYLTDISPEHPCGTETIPGSHLFGQPPPPVMEGTPWEARKEKNVGPMGSVVMFNNQVWHHGGLNTSSRTRYVTQVTYARRIISHMFYNGDVGPMNYQMPDHVYRDASPRLKRLLGFLPHGAYG
jgi:ectoine hydroxylase-related dioxygenase (phytanoyl-CoA dioxygenase family)